MRSVREELRRAVYTKPFFMAFFVVLSSTARRTWEPAVVLDLPEPHERRNVRGKMLAVGGYDADIRRYDAPLMPDLALLKLLIRVIDFPLANQGGVE